MISQALTAAPGTVVHLEVPAVSLSAALWAAAPSPTPAESGTPRVPSLQDAQESATSAAGWVEENWSTWLAIGLRVLLILVIATVLRVLVRRAITKLVDRMSRTGQALEGGGLGACWSTPSAAASGPWRSARCCARWRPS